VRCEREGVVRVERRPRAVVLVLDSVGVGALPDAAAYGDAGSDTLGNTARAVGGLRLPVLGAFGLGNIADVLGVPPVEHARASWGRLALRSAGKDTTTGHWEMMGLTLVRPFPTYPDGFPSDVIEELCQRAGLPSVLGNRAASGTAIIDELGGEHVRTGMPIVYTSADSVFQVAAHEEEFGLERLYDVCAIARAILTGDHCVGRVIARPFGGPDAAGRYVRTHHRRDYSVAPFGPTALDALQSAGIAVRGVGKIGDIFAGRGVTTCEHTKDNMDGFDRLLSECARPDEAFVFCNLVDFDMLWGHRNDPAGYAGGLEAVDARMPELLDALDAGDLLIVTADHGCDPTTPSTDHSREYVPLLALVKGGGEGTALGTRATLADVGATVLDFYGLLEASEGGRAAATSLDVLAGHSFLGEVRAR